MHASGDTVVAISNDRQECEMQNKRSPAPSSTASATILSMLTRLTLMSACTDAHRTRTSRRASGKDRLLGHYRHPLQTLSVRFSLPRSKQITLSSAAVNSFLLRPRRDGESYRMCMLPSPPGCDQPDAPVLILVDGVPHSLSAARGRYGVR